LGTPERPVRVCRENAQDPRHRPRPGQTNVKRAGERMPMPHVASTLQRGSSLLSFAMGGIGHVINVGVSSSPSTGQSPCSLVSEKLDQTPWRTVCGCRHAKHAGLTPATAQSVLTCMFGAASVPRGAILVGKRGCPPYFVSSVSDSLAVAITILC
jgi:hypothetical protein